MFDRSYSVVLAVWSVLVLGWSASIGGADTIYVCWDGSGDYVTIQEGIDAASDGDEVVVCDGTYTGPGNKDLDFRGKAITVRSESGADNCTIDCEGDGRGFTFFNGETETSVVDGFTITSGLRSGGGAIYCDECSPTIVNCRITGNMADLGGGIFCDYFSDATIVNCTISSNTAGFFGGGVYCWLSSPTIDQCTIVENAALGCCGDGGGVHCDLFSHATITGCDISLNMAGRNGGGIYCDQSDPVISDCDITGNLAVEGGAADHGFGGGICLTDESGGTISDCTIMGNSSEEGGGVACCYYSSPTIAGCDISDNTTNDACGGIICEWQSDPLITDCTVTGNSADDEGGGICCTDFSEPTIRNCMILDNTTEIVGGGIRCDESDPTIIACTVAGNEAVSYGGGVACDLGSPSIDRCLIANNTAGTVGGGVACLDGSNAEVANCTITDNAATYDGGCFYIFDSSLTIRNSTSSGNIAAGWSSAVYCDGGDTTVANCILWADAVQEIVVAAGTLAVTYSDVQGGWPGDGNIGEEPNDDPLFVDPDGADDDPDTWEDNDYHLSDGSPCIDIGDPDFVAGPDERDIDEQMRVWDGDDDGDWRVDMGSDEFGSRMPGDLNGDGCINQSDLGILLADWGCSGGDCSGDCDGDGNTDQADLGVLLAHWGEGCP